MSVKADPGEAGRRLGDFFLGVEARLWRDLRETGTVPGGADARVRAEWECLALDACLRGLVAAGGFGDHTVRAVDAFHAAVLEAWAAGAPEPTLAARRERLTARYEEYGRLARDLEAKGAALVSARLGETAAAHACSPGPAAADLAALLGAMHEALVEGAFAALDSPRAGEPGESP
jgi:hypothetical protein